MYIWIGIAFFFLSIMETVSHHFNGSVFAKIKNEFWYEFFKSDWKRKYINIETLEKKKGLKYFFALINAYHVSKWLIIFCFAMAIGFDYIIGFAAIQWLIHRIFYTKLWTKS